MSISCRISVLVIRERMVVYTVVNVHGTAVIFLS